ncbi:hypothetical protein [Streptomyces rimosus]|uniref:hypothetical protein n=1 Tax=Streptomyces rimosus TaxID=1927 RepID=UPI0004CAA009|nr:hypothetical protein [Streptomyces rimosus]
MGVDIFRLQQTSGQLSRLSPRLHPGQPGGQLLDGYWTGTTLLTMALAGDNHAHGTFEEPRYDALAALAHRKGCAVGLCGNLASYVGVHLLAGHVAAQSVLATCLADDTARADAELVDGVRGVITHLWPTPTRTEMTQFDVRIGGRLHQHVQKWDYRRLHPALLNLGRTAMCRGKEHSAALRKLHWAVVQHCEHRWDRLHVLGAAMAELLDRLPERTDEEDQAVAEEHVEQP